MPVLISRITPKRLQIEYITSKLVERQKEKNSTQQNIQRKSTEETEKQDGKN